MNLEGKVALVTGGSRGIGRAISLKLASMGADVAVNFFSNRSGAKNVVEEIEATGSRAIAVRANVGNQDHLQKMFQNIKETFGGLDILVSNAAFGTLKPAMEIELKDWERTMDTNARALLLCAQEAVNLMEGRKGFKQIIAITSQGSLRYIPNYTAVGASKAALESIMRYLAVELAGKDIRVNGVAAGVTDTASLKLFPLREKMLDETSRKTPVGRIGEPEDIANIVGLLCTDEAEWICGQVIVADGGYSLWS
jgi:enoyl-[acyl-carrier protein] reductase III